MSDLTMLIAGAIALGGYVLKSRKEKYENIYTSNYTEDATRTLQDLADKRYKDALNPTFSGIGDPVMYTTGQIGKEGVESFGDVTGLQNQYQTNMLVDPRLPKKPLAEPKSNKVVKSSDETVFESFSNSPETISKFTGETIELPPNTVPFISSSREEVRERFIPGILDSQTGNTSTYFAKKEAVSFADGIPVANVYTGVKYEGVKDRFHPSRYREGERPFQPERFQKPKAWSSDTPSEKDTFKTIDELYVNPKQSYKSVILQGQNKSENKRGIISNFAQNRQSTVTDKQYLTAESAYFKAEPADRDYSTALQNTNREGYNLEYTGVAQDSIPKTGNWIENYTEARKTATKADTVRNATSMNRATGDYNKKSIGVYNTERETYGAKPIVNVNNEKINTLVQFLDKAKPTARNTMKNQDIDLNSRSNFTKGSSDAVNNGVAGNQVKTTAKEQNLFDYTGIAKGKDKMGYLASEYQAKTTLKEGVADTPYSGNTTVPQFIGNNTLQRVSVNSSKTLAELQNDRTHTLSKLANYNIKIPTKNSIGIESRLHTDDKYDNTITNERLDPDLVHGQLEHNPYSIHK